MTGGDDLVVEVRPGHHACILNRPDSKNSLTPALVDAIAAALAACERDPGARALVIEARGGFFCNGMDLVGAAAAGGAGRGSDGDGGIRFARLLARFATASVVVIARVQGQVRGGGLGLIAACDFVFADPNIEFALPELLWGLSPCTIAPFLIRRIGARTTRTLSLSTLPITARQALEHGLVDSLEPDALQRLLRRLGAIPREGIGRAKAYLATLAPIDDAVLQRASAELAGILASPEVGDRLRTYAATGRFPWEQPRHAG
jgi:polyketide biosynthesis enoyl-CoA hydratase PksH